MDSKLKSATKSIIWRIVGVLILAAVTWFYTKSWITVGLVTIIHHVTFLFVYYFHERIWLKFNSPCGRQNCLLCNRFHGMKLKLLKMFTYETICGNILLGMITYFITGSWIAMTQITLTYIGIKHITYVINEFIWKTK